MNRLWRQAVVGQQRQIRIGVGPFAPLFIAAQPTGCRRTVVRLDYLGHITQFQQGALQAQAHRAQRFRLRHPPPFPVGIRQDAVDEHVFERLSL